MFLGIDIGNTNIKCGIFDYHNLIRIYRISSTINNEIEKQFEFLEEYDIETCTICSVVPELSDIVTEILNDKYKIKPLLVSSDTNTGIRVKIPNPKEMGADRLVNASAAYRMYSKPSIVIDAGSAITFDVIDNEGNFLGGIIMPGLSMQLKALHSYTAKLPLIKIEDIKNVIASNTKDAILAGSVIATACAVEGLIQRCKKELGEDVIIIGTGGDAEFLQKYMDNKFDYINPNLTLEGLKYIGMKELQKM